VKIVLKELKELKKLKGFEVLGPGLWELGKVENSKVAGRRIA
jgi:hypothetical protein